MKKLLTVNLKGKPLSWALAKACGRVVDISYDRDVCVQKEPCIWIRFEGYTDPALWARLIEQNRLRLTPSRMTVNEWYCDKLPSDNKQKIISGVGETPAEAVARCIVLMNLGNEVEIPDELISKPERSHPSSLDFSLVHNHD